MMKVRFYSVKGPFRTESTREFATGADALAAVIEYGKSKGFTNVKMVDDLDDVRFTATTPGGRAGRNIAGGWFE